MALGLDVGAVLRAGRDLDRNVLALEHAVDLDRAAAHGLERAHVLNAEQVIALTLESLGVGHLDAHDEVARAVAAHARLAIAGHLESLAGVDAGRNFDLDRLVVGRAALAVAGLAGVVDDVARAVAGRALHLRLHLAEDGALHGHDAARAVAARARRDLATLRGARAVAILAGGQAVVGHRLGAAGRGLLERDAQRDAHVTAGRAGGAPTARGPAVEE